MNFSTKSISALLLCVCALSALSCGEEDIGPGNKSTANTVQTFPIFTTDAPYDQKVIDKDGNLYFYVAKAGKVSIGTEKTYETTRNNTLLKVDPNLNEVTTYAGVRPFVDRKITVNPNGIIYMRSESNSSNSIIKLSTNGGYVTTDPIRLLADDIESDEDNSYYSLSYGTGTELIVSKYLENTNLAWSIAADAQYRGSVERLHYDQANDQILVVTWSKILSYNASTGEKKWEYATKDIDCSSVLIQADACTPEFIELSDKGEIYFAYTAKFLRNSEIESFVTYGKLNGNGEEQWSQTIKSQNVLKENVFVSGLTHYNGSIYMAINLTTERSGFAAEEAYIGKYDGQTGTEAWKQYPSWEYRKLDEFDAKEFTLILNPVFIKDLNQDPTTGKLWATVAIELSDNIAHPDGITGGKLNNGNITEIVAESYFGSLSHEQKYIPTSTVHRTISSLNP